MSMSLPEPLFLGATGRLAVEKVMRAFGDSKRRTRCSRDNLISAHRSFLR